ncbi:MAG: hypothetical protein JSW58_04395 [Candidatus Latescibacterota bacterium]|nr:MAG: hypothetical protein JSW58_04395 [Candidatus Latescibacterota bacterium]
MELSIFNVAGRKIRTLVDAVQLVGSYHVTWDARDDTGRSVASGVYFYRLTVRGAEQKGKMVLLR